MTCFDVSTKFDKDHFGTLNRRCSDAQPSGLGIQRLDLWAIWTLAWEPDLLMVYHDLPKTAFAPLIGWNLIHFGFSHFEAGIEEPGE